MKSSYALVLFGLSWMCSGCALFEDASRNMCVGLNSPFEEHRETARNRRWANEAWQTVCTTDRPGTHSEHYASGFKEGFAEYLFRGGDGEPPLVAPLRYRHIRYQTADGYRAVQDWFAGYRHGAALARESGARRWITGPSALEADPQGFVAPVQTHSPERLETAPFPEPIKMLPKGIDDPAQSREKVELGAPLNAARLRPKAAVEAPLPEPTVIPGSVGREDLRIKLNPEVRGAIVIQPVTAVEPAQTPTPVVRPEFNNPNTPLIGAPTFTQPRVSPPAIEQPIPAPPNEEGRTFTQPRIIPPAIEQPIPAPRTEEAPVRIVPPAPINEPARDPVIIRQWQKPETVPVQRDLIPSRSGGPTIINRGNEPIIINRGNQPTIINRGNEPTIINGSSAAPRPGYGDFEEQSLPEPVRVRITNIRLEPMELPEPIRARITSITTGAPQ